MDGILTYLIIGFIWGLMCDFLILPFPDNATRARYIFFWPISLGAFIYGAIIHIFNQNN